MALGASDAKIRAFVFEQFRERTTAPALEEVASAFGLARAEAAAALRRLDAAHQLKLLDGTDRILMAFPFSAVATPFRVGRTNGQRYFANCAYDAIAFHAMLEEPIRVDAFCAHCTDPVSFRLEQGHARPTDGELPLVQLQLPAAAWWNDIVRTCSNTMVYFASESHLRESQSRGTAPKEGVLTVEQVHRLGEPIYTGKIRAEYVRPAPDVLRAHFERLGLTGPYWRI
jgi:hypothetical protein